MLSFRWRSEFNAERSLWGSDNLCFGARADPRSIAKLALHAKYEEQKTLLLAVKWLGNAGSHDGEKATMADVRIAYDLLEHVLSEIYEGKGKKLKAIATKVNKKKGPVK